MCNKINVCLVDHREGETEKKVDVEIGLPSYLENIILNDIKGNLRIVLINRGYSGSYKLSTFPKITIIIE